MPRLNGQIIGQAERSTRALLERLLAKRGTPFERWVAINLTALAPGPLDGLVARMADGLKTDPASVTPVVDAAVRDGLLTGAGELTTAGRALFDDISAELAELTGRLYGDLPADDVETAGRVLLEVTARANSLLAAA